MLSVSVSDTSIIRLEYGLDSLDEGTLDEKVKIIAEEEEIDWYEVYLRKLRKRVYSDSLDGSDYIKLAKKKAELMMQDYYDYSRIGNPNEITDAMWYAYCTEFNLAIILCEVYSSDIHYFRNKLNLCEEL